MWSVKLIFQENLQYIYIYTHKTRSGFYLNLQVHMDIACLPRHACLAADFDLDVIVDAQHTASVRPENRGW